MGMNVRNTGCRVRPQTAKLQALTTAQQQYSRVTETKQSSGLSTRCTIQPQKKRNEYAFRHQFNERQVLHQAAQVQPQTECLQAF